MKNIFVDSSVSFPPMYIVKNALANFIRMTEILRQLFYLLTKNFQSHFSFDSLEWSSKIQVGHFQTLFFQWNTELDMTSLCLYRGKNFLIFSIWILDLMQISIHINL